MRRRLFARIAAEDGMGLVELLAAMVLLSIALMALISVFVSSTFAIRRAQTKSTALVLADKQMERYRSLPYCSIRLLASSIPSGSDPYVTANSTDSTIPASSGQALAGAGTCRAGTERACPTLSTPPECLATQSITGPDNAPYRIDTYVTYDTPPGGRQTKRVSVIVRTVSSGIAGTIEAREASTFDRAGAPS